MLNQLTEVDVEITESGISEIYHRKVNAYPVSGFMPLSTFI